VTANVGSTFAIGAGRHLDYRVIAAPDFLVRSGEYGVLGDIVRPTRFGQPARLQHAKTPGGQHLTIAGVTQDITSNDISDARPAADDADDAVRDEQNRPLRMIFGVAIDGTWAGTMDQADIDTARAAAMRAYRRFLAEEDAFPVVSSAAFLLHSELTPEAESTAPPRSLTPAAETPAHPADLVGNAPGGHRLKAILLAAALVVLAALAVLLLRPGTANTPTCPSPTTTGKVGVTASATNTPLTTNCQ
jgi:hypothetical protein